MLSAMRLLLVASLVTLANGGACAFLPDTSPVEHSLASMAVASLKFEGFSDPVVTRHESMDGEAKIRIVRSSEVPSITFENSEIIISTASCTADNMTTVTTDSVTTTTEVESAGAHRAATFTSFAVLGALATGMGNPTSSLLGAGLGILAAAGGAKADDSCSPSIEVEIFTPPMRAYEGVVHHLFAPADHCAPGSPAQVRGECPAPFPQFTVSTERAPSCGMAVIGAGAGGLYTALRLVDTNTKSASDICVFELTDRVGGRLVSLRGLGPNHDLSVDSGGYRTWPLYTPVLHTLITEYLNIPMGCYEVGVPEENCTRFNIVDEAGSKDGFATFVEEMMRRLSAAGVRYFPLHRLESITQTELKGPSVLHFANGVVATVSGEIILNVPQRPQLEIVRASSLPVGALTATTWEAMHTVQTEIATKLYLYYSRAWWRELGLTTGDFQYNGDATNMPIQGRYHDGHVECDENGENCHGFLLCTYIHDFSGENSMYFRRFQSDRNAPVTIISDSRVEGQLFLEHAHARLLEYHRYHLPAEVTANIPPYEVSQILDSTEAPLFAVMSNWNIATPGAGGAWHGWTDLDLVETARFPLESTGIYVVNEAFSLLQGWAEGSLKNADAVLNDHFSVSPPWSFVASDLVQRLAQTNPRIDPEDCESVSSGGNTSSGGGVGSSGDAGEDDVLCFAGDALLQLANGSMVRLADANVGMVVSDGAGKSGRITEVLVHEVKRTVQVAVLQTPFGELVAQPAHPIFVGGAWMELAAAHDAGHLTEVVYEDRYLDAFYNLEIDGNNLAVKISEETGVHHAYVVNGIIASGLGDSEELNSRYPRQNRWKVASTERILV